MRMLLKTLFLIALWVAVFFVFFHFWHYLNPDYPLDGNPPADPNPIRTVIAQKTMLDLITMQTPYGPLATLASFMTMLYVSTRAGTACISRSKCRLVALALLPFIITCLGAVTRLHHIVVSPGCDPCALQYRVAEQVLLIYYGATLGVIILLLGGLTSFTLKRTRTNPSGAR